MTVTINMVFAIAVITLATGAVPEFQMRMTDICSSAYCAAVVIWRLRCCFCCFIGTGIKLNDLGLSLGTSFLVEQSFCICPPRNRHNVQHIFAKEQEKYNQRNHRKEIIREGIS